MESLNTQSGDGSMGRDVLNIVRDTATSRLSSRKTGPRTASAVSRAVRQSTQSLRNNQQDTVAQYVEQAADRIEQFSSRLRDRDLGDLMRDADRFARRQPAIFIGAAFMVGVLAARFFKSSGNGSDRTSPLDRPRRLEPAPLRRQRGRTATRHDVVFHGGAVVAARPEERSIGELFAELSRETGTLVRKELELATTEMTAKARIAGAHLGTVAVGGAWPMPRCWCCWGQS